VFLESQYEKPAIYPNSLNGDGAVQDILKLLYYIVAVVMSEYDALASIQVKSANSTSRMSIFTFVPTSFHERSLSTNLVQYDCSFSDDKPQTKMKPFKKMRNLIINV